MSTLVIVVVAVGAGLTLGAAAYASWSRRPQPRLEPSPRRILFPFTGETVSRSAVDATLRLALAEDAALIPAYVATVPMELSLDAAVPDRCLTAMPVLETIEQRALSKGVPVDSRIETGRTERHALRRLLESETFDRIVVPAATSNTSGFSGADVAWLLEHAPGEVIVLRPGRDGVPPPAAVVSTPTAPRPHPREPVQPAH
jgi:hypothetical protein